MGAAVGDAIGKLLVIGVGLFLLFGAPLFFLLHSFTSTGERKSDEDEKEEE